MAFRRCPRRARLPGLDQIAAGQAQLGPGRIDREAGRQRSRPPHGDRRAVSDCRNCPSAPGRASQSPATGGGRPLRPMAAVRRRPTADAGAAGPGAAGISGQDAGSASSAAAAAPLPRSRGGETSSTVARTPAGRQGVIRAAPGSRSSSRSADVQRERLGRRLSRANRPAQRPHPRHRAARTDVHGEPAAAAGGGAPGPPCGRGGSRQPDVDHVGERSSRRAGSAPSPRPQLRWLTPRRFSATRATAATPGQPSRRATAMPLMRTGAPDRGEQQLVVRRATVPDLQRPGDHGAAAVDGERPVDPEPDRGAAGPAPGSRPASRPRAPRARAGPRRSPALTATAWHPAERCVPASRARGLPRCRRRRRPGRPG